LLQVHVATETIVKRAIFIGFHMHVERSCAVVHVCRNQFYSPVTVVRFLWSYRQILGVRKFRCRNRNQHSWIYF